MRYLLLTVVQLVLLAPIRASSDDVVSHLGERVHKLEEKLEKLWTENQDPLVLAMEAIDGAKDKGGLQRGALELERRALQGLDVQLQGLRAELGSLVRNTERHTDVADDIGELRAEAGAMQSEVRKLKADVERLRERRDRDMSVLGQVRTGQVAQRWLQKSVEELRTELGELAKVQNVSAALRQRQQWSAALGLLRSDVASLRADQEELRAGHEKHGALLRQLQQDMAEMRARDAHQVQAEQLLKEQVSQLKQEMSVRVDPVSRQQNMNSENEIDNHVVSDELWNYVTGKKHRLRHHGGLRAEVYAVIAKQAKLEEQLQHMRHNQSALEATTEQTKLQMSLLLNETDRAVQLLPPVQRSLEEVRRRLSTIEDESVSVHEAMRNASVAANGVEKLHTSTVQLFEALETLETECDRGVGTLRREMSKVEFNVAQMGSSVTVLKEDQTAQGSVLQTARRAVAQLQGRVDTHNYRLTSLEAEGVNVTLRRCKESNEQLLIKTKLQELEKDVDRLQQDGSAQDNTFSSHKDDDGGSDEEDTASAQNLSAQLPIITAHLATLDDANLKFIRHLPSDCSEVQSTSVILIHPPAMTKALEVLCHVNSPKGNGWTVFQRRVDKSENFDRTWEEYKNGFGDASGSYWLGNDALHALTSDGDHELRVELWDNQGHFRYVEYQIFAVDGEEEGYKLHLGGYSGNASDALRAHNGMLFSTKDKDMDHSSTNCAMFYMGGWWYNRCQQANANGHFDVGFTWYDSNQRVWQQMARIEMATRKRN